MNPAPPTQSAGGALIAPEYRKVKSVWDAIVNTFMFANNKIMTVNNSKLFAGLIIIVLNISSKFVTIKLSKSMEAYLKYTFSRNILIFAMAWMGTRDIYIAGFMTLLFIICMKYLFNEESPYCCLPEKFTEYHISLGETSDVTPEEVRQAKDILARAEAQEKRERGETTESFEANRHAKSLFRQPFMEEEDYQPYTE